MAKKISTSSQSVASSALHLNHIPGTQTQIVSTRFREVSPLTDLNQRSLRFEVPQDTREFIDLGETSLYVQCAIRNMNNTKIPADKPVGVVNYLLGSLFKRVTLSSESRPVSEPALRSIDCGVAEKKFAKSRSTNSSAISVISTS